MKITKSNILKIAGICAILFASSEIVAASKKEDKADDFMNKWFEAVSYGSPDKVIKLYKEDSVLLPTLSNEVHDLPEERLAYFKMFTGLPNLKGTINELHTKKLSDNVVNKSGIYTFTFEKDGKEVKVPARFS
ncbi:MAG: DUF4440 domain-containing protein, partial [Rickettsiales bacterium]|nr:DUF4440 domain-containing protein [Rickettsiales bacterium]